MSHTLKLSLSRPLALALPLLLASACITPQDGGRDPAPGAGGGAGADGRTPVAVDHASSTETVTQNLTTNVEELDASLEFLTESDLLPQLLRFGPGAAEEDGAAGQAFPEDGEEVEMVDDVDDVVEIELERPLSELIEELRERVLVAEAVEDDDDERTVIYRLRPERVCPEDDETGGVDEECIRQLTEAPVRVRVTSYEAGDVDLALLIGEQRLEVARAEIHRTLLAVELDLGAIRQAAELLADPEDADELPDVMQGVVRGELRRNAARDFTATIAILRDIRIEHADGDKEISVRIGETPALVSVRLDGIARVITAQLGIGEIEVAMPWQQIVDSIYASDAGGGCAAGIDENGNPGPVECWDAEEEGPATGSRRRRPGDSPAPQVEGTFELFLAGLTGRTSFSGDEDRIEITDLTLGAETSTVKVADDTLIALDLNKDAGRKAAIAFQEVRDGNLRIEVAPELDVMAQFALHHIEDTFEDIPPFMLNETLGVRLDGAATPALETVGADDSDRQLRVADGELTLWSTAMDDDVIIPEGMCVVGPDEDPDAPRPEGQHPLFGGIEAQRCGF